MKYVGSKRAMLESGLGEILRERASFVRRVVDPFCGSGVVAWHIAEHTDTPVFASDLQSFAAVMAGSVLHRTHELDADLIARDWFGRAKEIVNNSPAAEAAYVFESSSWETTPRDAVERAREICRRHAGHGVVTRAYGGYYFSPFQSLVLDALRMSIPAIEPERTVAMASLASGTYACAASPGHTAQPFKPSVEGHKHLFGAWRRSPYTYVRRELDEIAERKARKVGVATVSSAESIAATAKSGDLFIIDPPYSFVHYSRFYHVLETVVRGWCGPVAGSGRYPPLHERPSSNFSIKSRSRDALGSLLEKLADAKAEVVLTFPIGECSNGLSGDDVLSLSRNRFDVTRDIVNGKFSTLGGTGRSRPARHRSTEMLLQLVPRYS